jgi:3-methyl-2-oxobutanoate hydroxymethyltransferase
MPTTVLDLGRVKADGRRFTMPTCYDFQCAQIFDEVGIPLIFIGDTLGIFALGYNNTIPVTMDAMVHHCRAVSRGVRDALVVGDLPFGSYEASVADGVRNAVRPWSRKAAWPWSSWRGRTPTWSRPCAVRASR